MDHEDCDCELCVQYEDEIEGEFEGDFEDEQPYHHAVINYLFPNDPMIALQTALDEMLADAIAGRKAH